MICDSLFFLVCRILELKTRLSLESRLGRSPRLLQRRAVRRRLHKRVRVIPGESARLDAVNQVRRVALVVHDQVRALPAREAACRAVRELHFRAEGGIRRVRPRGSPLAAQRCRLSAC